MADRQQRGAHDETQRRGTPARGSHREWHGIGGMLVRGRSAEYLRSPKRTRSAVRADTLVSCATWRCWISSLCVGSPLRHTSRASLSRDPSSSRTALVPIRLASLTQRPSLSEKPCQPFARRQDARSAAPKSASASRWTQDGSGTSIQHTRERTPAGRRCYADAVRKGVDWCVPHHGRFRAASPASRPPSLRRHDLFVGRSSFMLQAD